MIDNICFCDTGATTYMPSWPHRRSRASLKTSPPPPAEPRRLERDKRGAPAGAPGTPPPPEANSHSHTPVKIRAHDVHVRTDRSLSGDSPTISTGTAGRSDGWPAKQNWPRHASWRPAGPERRTVQWLAGWLSLLPSLYCFSRSFSTLRRGHLPAPF